MSYRNKPEPFKGSLFGRDIISVEQFTDKKEIKTLFELADEMKKVSRGGKQGKTLKVIALPSFFTNQVQELLLRFCQPARDWEQLMLFP